MSSSKAPFLPLFFVFIIRPFGLSFPGFTLGQEAVSSVLAARSFDYGSSASWSSPDGDVKARFTKQGIFPEVLGQQQDNTNRLCSLLQS